MTPYGGVASPGSPSSPGGAETLWLRPGDVLIRQGELGRDLYVLLTGELKILSGEREIARVAGQGEVIGELGALTGRPRTASVVAFTAAEVLQVKLASAASLERLPKVLAKIDAAVSRRYFIVYNKNVLYRSTTATLRRMLLQDAMRTAFTAPRGTGGVLGRGGAAGRGSSSAPNRLDADAPGLLRQQVRQRLDDRLAMFPDSDDPKVLDRIAGEYGVQDLYRERLATFPWLDDDLIRKLADIDGSWQLAEAQRGSVAVQAKAECVIEATELLQKFESMPGIRREMDILRMEALVPTKAKIEALKTAFLGRHLDEIEDERTRLPLERQVKLAVEAAKADAGHDVVLVVRAARHLRVENLYEDQIRNLVAMAETGTNYVDVVPGAPGEETATRP